MLKKITILLLLATMWLLHGVFVSGCDFVQLEMPEAKFEVLQSAFETTAGVSETNETIIDDLVIPLAQFKPAFVIPTLEAPGFLSESNDRAFIDYSNKHDGYITVGFRDDTDKYLKVVITAPCGKEYIYVLKPGIDKFLPLTEGNGLYSVGVFERQTSTLFEQVVFASFDVILTDEFAPFLRPSLYIDYCKDSPVTEMATELFMENESFFDVVEAIYGFVVDNISYDFDLAESVEFGYTPDLALVLERRSGICFDLAALTVAMLRSQGVPAKMVFGDCNAPGLGYTYHAWVSVYSEEDGMVGDYISFTGGTWNLLDPTLVAILGLSNSIDIKSDLSLYQSMFYY